MVLFFINSRLQESNQINIMNRKEFLTRTGALLPLSFLGMPKASASAAAAMPATPAEAYWASEAYQSTAREWQVQDRTVYRRSLGAGQRRLGGRGRANA